MSEEDISVLSFVVGLYKFGVFNIFKALYFWFNNRSGSKRVYRLSIDISLNFGLSLLINVHIRTNIRLCLNYLSSQDIWDLTRNSFQGRISLISSTKFIGQLSASGIVGSSFPFELFFQFWVIRNQGNFIVDLLLMKDVIGCGLLWSFILYSFENTGSS